MGGARRQKSDLHLALLGAEFGAKILEHQHTELRRAWVFKEALRLRAPHQRGKTELVLQAPNDGQRARTPAGERQSEREHKIERATIRSYARVKCMKCMYQRTHNAISLDSYVTTMVCRTEGVMLSRIS